MLERGLSARRKGRLASSGEPVLGRSPSSGASAVAPSRVRSGDASIVAKHVAALVGRPGIAGDGISVPPRAALPLIALRI
ncbi:MAG: hypothetical protein OXG27_06665 [Chloroflexi bacterium]|nr:hypothetical protein [Chloroflexota bacterium]